MRTLWRRFGGRVSLGCDARPIRWSRPPAHRLTAHPQAKVKNLPGRAARAEGAGYPEGEGPTDSPRRAIGVAAWTHPVDEESHVNHRIVAGGIRRGDQEEIKKTRVTLQRVPAQPDFAPHPRSTPLGRLAPHIAQLAGFGLAVLTQDRLDFATGSYKPVPFESGAQLVGVLDEGAAKTREALARTPDAAWRERWQLLIDGKLLFDASRFIAYRQMFLNHLVHHRAQLGVYLRLTGQPVPSTYGPSADEAVGL
jgi:hypothetical protein